jgi:hypothetical protein
MKLPLPKIIDDFMDAASHAPLADCVASGMIATVAVEVWISAAEAASGAGQRCATRLRRLGWI